MSIDLGSKRLRRRIYVAGHRGMLGSALVRALRQNPTNILVTRTREELDLRDQAAVNDFFTKESIDLVYLTAARVGGIHANSNYPVDFLQDNLLIQTNVISSAFVAGITRLIFVGSNCAYPLNAPQPMGEELLLTGALEPTNESYALAKLAGIKLCHAYNIQHKQKGIDYRAVIPASLYGRGDNYSGTCSHVIPALIKKFHEAKISSSLEVTVWGTGNVLREFMYVDDLALGLIKVSELSPERYYRLASNPLRVLNLGPGVDIAISELALVIKEVVGFNGNIIFDDSKPDGVPRKLLRTCPDISRFWTPRTNLRLGIKMAYLSFLEGYDGKQE